MDRVDLLVFGPHPDDLEIGLGGAIAKHAAMGLRVGLCDLTAGEMSSNGTGGGPSGGWNRGKMLAALKVVPFVVAVQVPDAASFTGSASGSRFVVWLQVSSDGGGACWFIWLTITAITSTTGMIAMGSTKGRKPRGFLTSAASGFFTPWAAGLSPSHFVS